MARRVLVGERLGLGGGADLLCVEMSSFDAAGHLFGPDSAEMMDFTVRTDRQIAGFLDAIDRAVGLRDCVVVLTADHGISTATRVAGQLGLGGGRIDLTATLKELNRVLAGVTPLPNRHDYVIAAQMPWVFMDPAVWTLDAESRTRVMAAARQCLRGVEGIADVYTADELSGPAPPPADLQRYLAWRCYYPGRSGELYIGFSPYWNIKEGDFAEHVTSSSQDRHVPIMMMGGGMRPGRYYGPVDPADVPVTLAALLGIEPPLNAVGRVLNEALDPVPSPR
jgi:arylsulfatase A-like enzyme